FSAISLFLVLRAFSAGCTALTGIEATSNGVQAFRPPESKNAANTMAIMAVVLGFIFIGLTLLAYTLHVVPQPTETVVSQIAAGLFGRTTLYFLVQLGTALILLLAANTPFAGFPRVSSVLAKDKYFPHQFLGLGAKLVYSSGIVMLSLIAVLLVISFHADTHKLIPLYAVGVFLAFTISQLGMVRHWKKKHAHGRHPFHIWINAFGGGLTSIVLLIVFISKFRHGAWVLAPTILLIIFLMRATRAHYESVAEQLSLKGPVTKIPHEKTVVILVSGVHRGTLKAIDFAKTLHAAHVKAVHVALDSEETESIKKKWRQYVEGIRLDVIQSPYRDLLTPLVDYIGGVERRWENDSVIVVIPEFVPTKFWHYFLHNQTARQIRWALEHREDVEILDVPYRLHDKETWTVWRVLRVGFAESTKGLGKLLLRAKRKRLSKADCTTGT
ncbi:MAG: APC family permease, partial [Parcubacteria group bacterium]|nr:APC family permease [Parcubacteria group bacterium]